ncbi:AMP-binding protein [Terrarubrum flagellatum]|uniref:AMP-binding protein n=1 Tax=Terrirubrum flagellatum TaxID=2895980 RepID=UPI0031453CB0
MKIDGRGLGEIARELTAEDPDRVLVVDGTRALTRAEMLDAALRLGGAMQAQGLARGASVAFQLPNWWEACVVNLTAALFGYRLAPLLTIYRAAELGVMLPACAVEAIFIPERFRGADFPALIASLSYQPRHIFIVRGDGSNAHSFENLIKHAPGEPEPASAGDMKMVLFTSGSTGRPKGVIHSHGAVDVLIRATGAFWETGEGDRLYIPSPIGHIGGSIYAFEFPWITGCVALLAESWQADEAVAAIDQHQATFMAGATPFLSGLIDAAERAGSRLLSLRRYICGGASVPPELVRRALRQFPNATVSRAYGSTEVPLICPGLRTRGEAEAHADTDGECASDIQILGDQGTEAAEGAAGEIVVRGPQMFLGYLDPNDDVDAFTENGFFRMGDLGRRIDGRYLEITGRKKDIIIRKGENISPLEIENALARHEAVKQSAIIGMPDASRGEIVVAFVLPIEGKPFSFQDMTSHLEALGLAKQKFPERLHVVSSLPVNSIGKVQKAELRQLAAGAVQGDN